jgi:hypothetical protein
MFVFFRETVAVYCENHTEHTDSLCGQNAVYINSVRTSQETHYVSTTKPNRLMLFRETVAVYCEPHTEHIYTLCMRKKWTDLNVKADGSYTYHCALKG